MTTTLFYFAMAAIHLGFFWGLCNAYVALRLSRHLVLMLSVGILALLGEGIFRVYEVVPVMWWPETSLHFVDRVGRCATYIFFIAVLTLGLRTKKKEPLPREAAPESRR